VTQWQSEAEYNGRLVPRTVRVTGTDRGAEWRVVCDVIATPVDVPLVDLAVVKVVDAARDAVVRHNKRLTA